MQVSTSSINHNSEKFINGTYNGFSIIIRNSDKYVNATKMVSLINKKEGKKKQLKKWFDSGMYEELSEELQCKLRIDEAGKILPAYENIKYTLETGYTKKLTGTYIHPRLINAVAMWVSPKYTVAVSEIMDSINDRTQATGETFEIIKDETIKRQRDVIAEAQETICEQEIIIHNESVRSDNSNKKLYILEHDNVYKLCANSTNIPKNIVKMFIFPSSMHIRKEVIDKFKIKEFTFSEEILNDVIAFIESKNPK